MSEWREGKEKKTEIRQSSPRHGREGSRWHRLASVVQAPASHTTPTQQQNQKKKENNQVNTTFTTNRAKWEKKKSKTNEKRDKLDNLRTRGGRTNGRARVRTAQTVMVVVVMTIMMIIMAMMIKRRKKKRKKKNRGATRSCCFVRRFDAVRLSAKSDDHNSSAKRSFNSRSKRESYQLFPPCFSQSFIYT